MCSLQGLSTTGASKTYVEKGDTKRKRWLRRARLVARDYALDKRDDVYSPASGQRALRLLPVLFRRAASDSQRGDGL